MSGAPVTKPRVMADLPLPAHIHQPLSERVQLVPWDADPREAEQIVGLYTFGHPTVDQTLLERLPALRVISNHGVGIDHIDQTAAERRGVHVVNTPGVLDGATADLGFALLLAAARCVVPSANFARHAAVPQFDQAMFHGREVHGAVLGIVGMGRIGYQLARRAQGFDMQVLYCNRRRNLKAESELNVVFTPLDQLLEKADFVVLTVPLTAETTRLIDRTALLRMQPNAVLVNIARGAVIDTRALVEVLEQGHLFAVALDVTDPEPLPGDHPLRRIDRVLITPHIGSATVQTRHQMAHLSIANLFHHLPRK